MRFALRLNGTTACKWDTILPFDKLWQAYERIIKDNGAIVLTASQPFTSALVMSNLKLFRYEWIWHKAYKTLHPRASFRPLLEHESILIFYKKQPTYNPQDLLLHNKLVNQKLTTLNETSVYAHHSNFKDREIYVKKYKNFPSTVLKIGKHINAKGNGHLHPTQKDVALMEYLIKTYTNEGDLVLDNTFGSGTTAVACQNLNRQFVGMEKEKKYFDIAVQRLLHEII